MPSKFERFSYYFPNYLPPFDWKVPASLLSMPSILMNIYIGYRKLNAEIKLNVSFFLFKVCDASYDLYSMKDGYYLKLRI
jgi:hypothetical protein